MAKRVLVIDDEVIVYDLMKGYLRLLDERTVSLHWANTPEDGLAQVTAAEWDAVFVDVAFDTEHTSGIELIAEIRGVVDRKTPVIALTNYGYADIRERCTEAGASAFIEKWPRKSEMVRTLCRCLGAKPVTGTDSHML